MAKREKRLDANVAGEFYVDSTCINCDTCRWMAPETFGYHERLSYVHHQPDSEEDILNALRAQLSCPVGSIGTMNRSDKMKEAQETLPIKLDEHIYHCGYHSRKSFGAANYLITHPEGNILFDTPRYNTSLLDQIIKLGGVKYIILSHIDDIGDHQEWAHALGAKRIMHADDFRDLPIEIVLHGSEEYELYHNLTLIPVPGHTKGSIVALFEKSLFTGDHLAWSEHEKQLIAWRNFCWYDWSQQIQSMEKLLDYSFDAIYPGHGRRLKSSNMRSELERCIEKMKA